LAFGRDKAEWVDSEVLPSRLVRDLPPKDGGRPWTHRPWELEPELKLDPKVFEALLEMWRK
jgi:hypothetical protein